MAGYAQEEDRSFFLHMDTRDGDGGRVRTEIHVMS